MKSVKDQNPSSDSVLSSGRKPLGPQPKGVVGTQKTVKTHRTFRPHSNLSR